MDLVWLDADVFRDEIAHPFGTDSVEQIWTDGEPVSRYFAGVAHFRVYASLESM